jgi:hypothetical protein
MTNSDKNKEEHMNGTHKTAGTPLKDQANESLA